MQKTTVVDVTRALDVSHGTIYRHYPSKQALRDTVTRRWLHRVALPLRAIAEEQRPVRRCGRAVGSRARSRSRRKALDDPRAAARAVFDATALPSPGA
jgi:AcrR family transcriptional regulator